MQTQFMSVVGFEHDLSRPLVELGGQMLRFVSQLAVGRSGAWLLAAIVDLTLLAGLAWNRSGRPQAGPARWRMIYGALLAIGLACLLMVGDPRRLPPAQGVTAAVLAVVAGIHTIWFGADCLARLLGFHAMQEWCERIAANRAAYYLIFPPLTLLAIFNYVPAVSIFQTSFYSYDLGGSAAWVGPGNYLRMLEDPVFWKSMRNLMIFLACQVILSLSVPLLAAELVFHLDRERSRYWLRTLFLIPIVVPAVVVYLIWQFLYSDAGPIALLGHALGLGDAAEGLLSRPQTALAAVIFVGFPFVNGINLLIFYAGLSSIPDTTWEAARLDGASTWRRFTHIDLPLLSRQHRLLAILAVIGAVQAFENVLVMTQGGPGWETMLPGLYMYRSAIAFNEFGYACALGVVLFLMVLLITFAISFAFGAGENA